MGLLKEFDQRDLNVVGVELHQLAAELFPICRSITGGGVRKTLAAIRDRIPVEISEVPSGAAVLDWTIPKEWNIRDAFIKGPDGSKVVDFRNSNLHVLNYSEPIQKKMRLDELKEHLFTIPEHPDWIPYRTSYYRENWGFCLSHNQMLKLEDGEYEAVIDSTLQDGHLTYGECYLSGQLPDEVLISTHICHPSLANDNLSGLVIAASIAQFLLKRELRYSYRFLFAPGTIGAISWLARNGERASGIKHGLVLAALGDESQLLYKRSRRGNAEIDRAVAQALRDAGGEAETLNFSPYGYDERQYCSPGFNLPVGSLTRSVGEGPENHTSADNLDFIRPLKLAESMRHCVSVIDTLENNLRYQNLYPYGEPHLGKRNLYRPTGGVGIDADLNAMLWVLNFSDGSHSLLDIAEKSGIPFQKISCAARTLRGHDLLSVASDTTGHD